MKKSGKNDFFPNKDFKIISDIDYANEDYSNKLMSSTEFKDNLPFNEKNNHKNDERKVKSSPKPIRVINSSVDYENIKFNKKKISQNLNHVKHFIKF